MTFQSIYTYIFYIMHKEFFGRKITTLERVFIGKNILRPPRPHATLTTPSPKSWVATLQPSRIYAYAI